MKKMEHVLARSARPKPSRLTERRIVAFRSGDAYRRCLHRLAARGIRPVQASPALRMSCWYARKRDRWERLRAHPDVAYVERDGKVTAHGLRSGRRGCGCSRAGRAARPAGGAKPACPRKAPWNVCRVQSPPLWSRTKGGCIKTAILDTGIARHPDLRIAGGVNTIGGKSFADDNGHGTHVAGIAAATGAGRIFGNAPRARLYAVKALDSSGSGYISDIVQGIDWCVRHGIRVINMSFGTRERSRALRAAVRRARCKGIVLVASAGNDGRQSGGIDAPAKYPETLAVAATTRRNRVASFSSRGKGIDLAAPGVNILSTWLNGTYVKESGTSMSAPHVTGGAALLLALSPKLGPAAIGRRLRRAARAIPGGRLAVGAGLLQVAPAAPGRAAGTAPCRKRRKR